MKKAKRNLKRKNSTAKRKKPLTVEEKLAINRANQETLKEINLKIMKKVFAKYGAKVELKPGDDPDADAYFRFKKNLARLKKEETELLKEKHSRKL